jgi:ABC-type glycerol-3-phosphate transport system substrate-binding protein
MLKTAMKPLLLVASCLALAACAQTSGGTSAYGAAPQRYEPPQTVTCTNSGDWGVGWSQDCQNRNGP